MRTVTLSELRRALRDGKPLGTAGADRPDCVIRGTVLRRVLLEEASKAQCIWLRAIEVQGPLIMPSSLVGMRVRFESCHFRDTVLWDQSAFPEISLRNCSFHGQFLASALSVEWNMVCSGSAFERGLFMDQCDIGGSLDLSGVSISPEPTGATCLRLDGATVAGGCFINHAQLRGEMTVMGARVGDELSLSDTTISTPSGMGIAIRGDRLKVSAGMFCDRFQAKGEVRLPNAAIAGTLRFTDAHLEAEPSRDFLGRALMADGIAVAADMSFRNLTARGELRFPGAKISGQLTLNSSTVEANSELGVSFNGDRLEVGGSAFFHDLKSTGEVRMLGLSTRGQVTMQNAQIEIADQGATVDALSFDGAEIGDGLLLDGVRLVGCLRLPGVEVGGDLSLGGSTVKAPRASGVALIADGCSIGGSLYATKLEAKGSLLFRGADIKGQAFMRSARVEVLYDYPRTSAIAFDRAEIAGGIDMRGLRCYGTIRLEGADVGVQLLLTQARLESTGGGGSLVALNGDGMDVDGVASFSGTRVIGEIRMIGATIRTQLSFNDCLLEARDLPDNATISLDGARTNDLSCRRLRARGEVRLIQAVFEGQVAFDGAVLNAGNNQTDCLAADGLVVKGGFSCIALRSHGKVGLFGATISGQLSLIEVRLTAGDSEIALGLAGATIDELILVPKHVTGIVDLRHAAARTLWDAEEGDFVGSLPDDLRLEGFRYELREPLDAKRRLEWIGRPSDRRHVAGVYAELANAFRRVGETAAAREVSIAGERQARQRFSRFEAAGLWQDLLYVTIGYGYRNWLAAVWLLLLVVLGGLCFLVGESSFTPALEQPPDFNPFLYAVDVTIPILDIGQQKAWEVSGIEAWLALALSIAGYALATAVIAAATGLFNRETAR